MPTWRVGDLHRLPGAHFRRQVERLVLGAPEQDARDDLGQLFQVGGAVRVEAEVVADGGTVADRVAVEAGREWMAHGFEQVEQVAWTTAHRRAGQQVDHVRASVRRQSVADAQQPQHVLGPLRVVLDVVRLVDDDAGPG